MTSPKTTLMRLPLFAAALAGFLGVASPQDLVPTKDPGVARAALMINPKAGVDVLRLEFEPGKARSVHQHDDVRFHLFLPISGSIEVTMGDRKLQAKPGESYFFETGVPHGYRNTGTTKAAGFEVFVRDPKPADGKAEPGKAKGEVRQ